MATKLTILEPFDVPVKLPHGKSFVAEAQVGVYTIHEWNTVMLWVTHRAEGEEDENLEVCVSVELDSLYAHKDQLLVE